MAIALVVGVDYSEGKLEAVMLGLISGHIRQ